MQFRARVIAGGSIHRRWMAERRQGGQVQGVKFTRHGAEFRTDTLNEKDLETLRYNPLLEIVAVTHGAGQAKRVEQGGVEDAEDADGEEFGDVVSELEAEDQAETETPVRRTRGRPRKG